MYCAGGAVVVFVIDSGKGGSAAADVPAVIKVIVAKFIFKDK